MLNWFSWIIAIIRAWLGIEADIKQKQEEHVGEVNQQNADLAQELKDKTHEAEVFEAPDRPESAVIDDMLKHAGK